MCTLLHASEVERQLSNVNTTVGLKLSTSPVTGGWFIYLVAVTAT
jgi:hypothetical protein